MSALTWAGGAPISAALGKKYGTLCSGPGITPTGVYTSSKSAAYVENWSSGNLTLCQKGVDRTIATVPSAVAGHGYYGMAGVVVKGSLDLVLISWYVQAGWYCLGASSSGCTSTTTFTLPATFCSSQSAGRCNPDGLVLESNLSFTYADIVNAGLYTCTASASACTLDAASSAFSGYMPVGITQKGSTLYVSDTSCTGNIWSGTTSSMKVAYTLGNSLDGIAFHKKTLYVADDAICGGNAEILNAKTAAALSTPITGTTTIAGLDSDLQWSAIGYDAVYTN